VRLIQTASFVVQCCLWVGRGAQRLCIVFAWNRANQLVNILFLLHHHEGIVHIGITSHVPDDVAYVAFA